MHFITTKECKSHALSSLRAYSNKHNKCRGGTATHIVGYRAPPWSPWMVPSGGNFDAVHSISFFSLLEKCARTRYPLSLSHSVYLREYLLFLPSSAHLYTHRCRVQMYSAFHNRGCKTTSYTHTHARV